jgi:hypothetical protein
MKYKTEPHIHLSEVSPCARLSAHEMIRLYAEAGYHTVFISDHLHRNCFARFGDIQWREKIARFDSPAATPLLDVGCQFLASHVHPLIPCQA